MQTFIAVREALLVFEMGLANGLVKTCTTLVLAEHRMHQVHTGRMCGEACCVLVQVCT